MHLVYLTNEEKKKITDDITKNTNGLVKAAEDIAKATEDIGNLSRDIATKASAIKEKASGEVIVVTDSAEVKPLGLTIDGKSEQKQYSGNQLLDASKIPTKSQGGAKVTNNGDGSFTVSGSGLLSEAYDNTYTLSHESFVSLFKAGKVYLKTDFISGPYLYIHIRNESGIVKSYSLEQRLIIEGEILQSYLDDESIYMIIGFYGFNNMSIVNNTIRLMIYQDGDGTWEPFVGGKPSPSPEFKQEIVNNGVYDEASGKYKVTVKGTKKNWFSELFEGYLMGSDAEGYSVVSGTNSYTLIGKVNNNTDYVVKKHSDGNRFRIVLFKDKPTKEYSLGSTQVISDDSITEYTFNSLDYNYVVFTLNYDNANITTKNAQLEIGTVATDYEPYKETTAEILLDEPLRGIDEVTDRINFETKKRINRIGMLNVAECDVRDWGAGSIGHDFYIRLESHDASYGRKLLKTMCNKFNAQSSSILGIDEVSYSTTADSGWSYYGRLGFRVNAEIDTVEKFKEYVGNDCIVIYERITPIIEEIDINSDLSMFYPTTILSNDGNTNMEVEYVVDTKTYIDKKFAELAAAMS